VLAVAETLGAGEGPPGAPWAEEAAAAQDLGCGIGEPGQVVEVLLAHEILSASASRTASANRIRTSTSRHHAVLRPRPR